MTAVRLRCQAQGCTAVLAFARRERIRPARGVALGALPSGKVRLVCPQCGAYRDLDGLTIVLLRAATASAILSTK